MTVIQIPADIHQHFAGTLSAANMTYPKEQLSDEHVKPGAKIAATKLIHQFPIRHSQKGGTAVVAETVPIHTFRSAAEIVAVEVVPLTPPSGGDLQYSVDVQKGNQATPPATILTAPVAIDSGEAARQVVSGILTTTEAADGDTLLAVVAVSGSTGTQGQGFLLTVWVREES